MSRLYRLRRYRRAVLERAAIREEIKRTREEGAEVTEAVQASLAEFPYTKTRTRVEGRILSARDQERTRELAAIEAELNKEIWETEKMVADVRDPLIRACAEIHYLGNKTWRETAVLMYGTPSAMDTIRMMVNRFFDRREEERR